MVADFRIFVNVTVSLGLTHFFGVEGSLPRLFEE
jgi:hypothetical protein